MDIETTAYCVLGGGGGNTGVASTLEMLFHLLGAVAILFLDFTVDSRKGHDKYKLQGE